MYLIGNGIDIHKLELKENSTKQKIGGITIDTNYKIIAHSDGDIVIHSICDAILGALSLDDIGEYFSDNDVNNKDIDSKIILNKCLEFMKNKKYSIHNIDITIICEHIIFKDIKKNIIKNLKEMLSCGKISFKATKWEDDKLYIQCNTSLLLKRV